jgi:hypothetical protein
MKSLFLPIALTIWMAVLAVAGLTAQEPFLRDSATLMIQVNVHPASHGDQPSFSVFNSPDWFQVVRIRMENGDLMLDYELGEKKKVAYYEVLLKEIRNRSKNLTVPLHPEYLFGDYGKVETAETLSKNLLLLNPPDNTNLKYLDGELLLRLYTALYDTGKEYDCANPPQFKFKQQLPYYLFGLIGTGAIVAGQMLKNESQDIYNNQYRIQTSRLDAEPFYDKANDKHQDYRRLTYIGIGILAADAVAFGIRWLVVHKGNMREFKDQCGENRAGLTFRPYYETHPLGGNPHTGLELTLKF